MLGLKTTQNSTFSKIDSKYFSSINQFHSIYIVKSSVAVRFGKTPFDRTTEPHRTSPNCWFDRTTEPNRKVRSYTIWISAVCLPLFLKTRHLAANLGDTEKLIFLCSWSWSIWMFSSQWCHSLSWRLSQVLHVLGQCQWRLWLARIHMWRLGIWPPYWCLYWPCLTLKW